MNPKNDGIIEGIIISLLLYIGTIIVTGLFFGAIIKEIVNSCSKEEEYDQ